MSDISNLSFHVNKFNDKVRIMNQAGSKNLILTPQEARDLQADIFALMEIISHYANVKPDTMPTSIHFDGGGF
jgi:hypothetical protein